MTDELEEGQAHAALFAHVGVQDLSDWRTVALRLAERHVPQVLTSEVPRPASRKKAGRPEHWSEARLHMLLMMIDVVKEASQAGRIRGDLETDRAALRFIAGRYPETHQYREAIGLKPDMKTGALDNLLRRALRLRESLKTGEIP